MVICAKLNFITRFEPEKKMNVAIERSVVIDVFHDVRPDFDNAYAIAAAVDITQRVYHVETVDSVPAMINLARQNATRFGVEHQIHSQVVDVYHLVFTDQFFDLVIARWAWLLDWQTCLPPRKGWPVCWPAGNPVDDYGQPLPAQSPARSSGSGLQKRDSAKYPTTRAPKKAHCC